MGLSSFLLELMRQNDRLRDLAHRFLPLHALSLQYAKRALVIPRVMHRKEQLIRARRLHENGLVTVLHPADVTPGELFRQVTSQLANDSEPIASARERGIFKFDGAERFGDFCSKLTIFTTESEAAANE